MVFSIKETFMKSFIKKDEFKEIKKTKGKEIKIQKLRETVDVKKDKKMTNQKS